MEAGKYTHFSPPAFDPYEQNDHDKFSVYTRATSGVIAPDDSGQKNDLGHTEAEEVANSYRLSPLKEYQEPSSSSMTLGRELSSPNDKQEDNRSSYYKPYNAEDDQSLVGNAAGMGGLDKSKSMGELGKLMSPILKSRAHKLSQSIRIPTRIEIS